MKFPMSWQLRHNHDYFPNKTGKFETHTDVKSPIFAISFHVSGSTPLYMPLLLTTMMITGRLYLLKKDHMEFRHSTVAGASVI